MGGAKDAQWSSLNDGQKVREVLALARSVGAGPAAACQFWASEHCSSASDWVPYVSRRLPMAARCPTSEAS